MKKTLHEKLYLLSRVRKISQTDVALHLDVNLSHINRYFNGKSNLSAEHVVKLLRFLGVELDQIIDDSLKYQGHVVDGEVETVGECISYLFNNLDHLGQQTFLNSLAWANRVSNKKKLPVKVEELLKREISLI